MPSDKNRTIKTPEDLLASNKNILAEHYDLGRLAHQERICRGYINDSYKIGMLRDGKKRRYLMRRYQKGTPEAHIQFEHALLHELQIRGFKFSPRLIFTKDGKTYIKIGRQLENQVHKTYIALFSFLPGKDKYSWDSPICSDEELRNSAKIFAIYHNTIFNWKGIECWRGLSNFDGMNLLSSKWKAYRRDTIKSPFDEYLMEQFDSLLNMLNNLPPPTICQAMPRLAVHGDYHPGNLRYKGGKVAGVFDFGWSKIDARCFDVGLAIMYFCTTWENNNDGILQFDRVENFLEAYQETAKNAKTIGPLDKLELEHLPHMIHLGNLIVVDWILTDTYPTSQYPKQYRKYLRHSMSLNRCLESNWRVLANCVQRHRA
jgi:homoserine kinase type II